MNSKKVILIEKRLEVGAVFFERLAVFRRERAFISKKNYFTTWGYVKIGAL